MRMIGVMTRRRGGGAHLGVVVHAVCVGEDAAAGQQEAAAAAAVLALALPRQAVVRLAVHAEHLRRPRAGNLTPCGAHAAFVCATRPLRIVRLQEIGCEPGGRQTPPPLRLQQEAPPTTSQCNLSIPPAISRLLPGNSGAAAAGSSLEKIQLCLLLN